MRPIQHPSNNSVLRAPPDATIDECVPLAITRLRFADDGGHGTVSFWQPTPAQMRLVAEGRPVRLCVMGTTHPPLSLGVDGDGMIGGLP